jgi:hypothetical protein
VKEEKKKKRRKRRKRRKRKKGKKFSRCREAETVAVCSPTGEAFIFTMAHLPQTRVYFKLECRIFQEDIS